MTLLSRNIFRAFPNHLSLIALVAGAAASTMACGDGDQSFTAGAAPRDHVPQAGEGNLAPGASGAGGAATAGTGSTATGGSDAKGGSPSTGGSSTGGSNAGKGGSLSTGGSGGKTNGTPVAIDNVRCVHERGGFTAVTEGLGIDCSFDALGEPGRDVTFRCEEPNGDPIDCDPSTSQGTQIYPGDATPMPARASFWAFTDGLAGTTYSIVLVAGDGESEARYRLDVPIVADDNVPEPTAISVDCGSSAPRVTAGEELDCEILVTDPDPELVSWDVNLTSAVVPTGWYSPVGGGGFGGYVMGFTFFTDVADAGQTFDFAFVATDGAGARVSTSLTIAVD